MNFKGCWMSARCELFLLSQACTFRPQRAMPSEGDRSGSTAFRVRAYRVYGRHT